MLKIHELGAVDIKGNQWVTIKERNKYHFVKLLQVKRRKYVIPGTRFKQDNIVSCLSSIDVQ